MAVLVAVFISNVPESIAASATLRNSGWSQARIYLMWTVIVLASGTAAALGYQLLAGASSQPLAFVLAFAGGPSSPCWPRR